MPTIKQIFDEIQNESSTNKKMEILQSHADNELLKYILYQANSKRVKFFIKNIPEYKCEIEDTNHIPLNYAVVGLLQISSRELTGDQAKSHLSSILSSIHPDDAHIIKCIIEKDCRLGIGTKIINKVWPDLIEKTGYMGCKPYSKDLILKILDKGIAYSQVKMDGRFVNIITRNYEPEMESRQGEPTILENPAFLSELRRLPDCVLNAELTMNGVSRYESNGIIASLISIANKQNAGENVSKEIQKFESKHMNYRQALDAIRVTAWDILTVDEYYNRKSKTIYEVRWKSLCATLEGFKMITPVETRLVHNIQEALQHFEEMLARGEEGTVLKSIDGLWVDSKPSYQVKLKKEVMLDLKITGFNYGTGKNSELISSLNTESSDGLLKTSPTGITEDDMIYITANMDSLLGKIVEVKCSGVSQDNTGNYSVLHPVFRHIRDDKYVANSLIECIEINNASSLL